jgi:hypothetical protein
MDEGKTMPLDQQSAKPNLPTWWPQFIQNIAELPDRNSPDDEPDAMVATAKELEACYENAIAQDAEFRQSMSSAKYIFGLTANAFPPDHEHRDAYFFALNSKGSFILLRQRNDTICCWCRDSLVWLSGWDKSALKYAVPCHPQQAILTIEEWR